MLYTDIHDVLIRQLKSLADVEINDELMAADILYDGFHVHVTFEHRIITEDTSFSHLFGVFEDTEKSIEVDIWDYTLIKNEDDGHIPNIVKRIFSNTNLQSDVKGALSYILSLKLNETLQII